MIHDLGEFVVLLAWSLQLLHVVPISPLLGHGTRSGTPKLDGSQDDKVLWMPRKKWPRLRPFGEHHPFLYGEFLHSSSRLKTMFFFNIFPNFSGDSLKFPYSISGWSYFARSFLWSIAIFMGKFLPGQYRGWQPVATLVQREWWIFTRPHNWSFQWETLEF